MQTLYFCKWNSIMQSYVLSGKRRPWLFTDIYFSRNTSAILNCHLWNDSRLRHVIMVSSSSWCFTIWYHHLASWLESEHTVSLMLKCIFLDLWICNCNTPSLSFSFQVTSECYCSVYKIDTVINRWEFQGDMFRA